MKSKLTKLLALCFIASMLLTACTGGGETVNPSDKPTTSPQATEKPAETEDTLEEIDYWSRYDEPVTVRFAVLGAEDGFSWSDNIWTQAWKEQFNIETEIMWNTGTTEAYQTKFAMAMLTGDLPDYMYLTAGQFKQLYEAGHLADITEAYDKYIYPHLKQTVFEANEGMQDIAFIDGKRYGIATEGINNSYTRLIYIRKDYMEKVGAQVPKTTEELIELGKKFVDAGLAKYALPLIGKVTTEAYSDIRAIANGFGVYPGIWVDDGNGGMMYGSIDPKMEGVLNIYRDLYKQGYIDPTFPSAVGDNLTQQILNGEVGILTGEFWVATWPLPQLLDEEGKVVDWEIINVLPSENNTNHKYQAFGSPADTKFVAVRAGYEHPDAIMKLINHRHAMLDDPDMAITEFHSIKDENGNEIGNHMRCPIREYFNSPFTNQLTSPAVTEAIDTGNLDALVSPHDKLQYENVTNYLKAVEAGDIEGMNYGWAVYKLFYGEDSVFGLFHKNFTNNLYFWDLRDKTTENYERLWGTMQQYENTFYVNYISGSEDTTFAQFVQEWNDMGGELITYELNH
ncbi:MAG TPA: extracellular solute-binding protein [Clostridiales bacterium]|nr:extracellular solute-binding protein [Clostridiales bacterium]